MKFTLMLSILLASICSSTAAKAAALEPISVTSEDKFPAPRWIYGFGQPPKEDGDTVSQLAAVKAAQVKQKYSVCVDKARGLKGKAKSLSAWLTVLEIECAVHLEPSAPNANVLARALDVVGKNGSWLVGGAQSSRLREAVTTGYQVLLDQDIKTNRARAWSDVDQLESLMTYLDDQKKAKLWRSAGELAFVQQKPEAARDFLRRSLAAVENDDVRTRLSVIEAAIAGKSLKEIEAAAKASGQKPANGRTSPPAEASKEELELVERITTALRIGDFVPAMEDAVKLIREYPGGTRAKWASDRVLETVSSLADRVEPKYESLREQIVAKLSKADSDRLADWARVFYNRGQYADAQRLSKKSLEIMDGARRTPVLELQAEAAIAVEDWDAAQAALRELIDRHAGQPQSREALLRMGLLKYRQAQYLEAIANFERLLALSRIEGYELSALYWLWRSLQKAQPERASQVADQIMLKFPFSYYGLRARAEIGEKNLEWSAKRQKTEAKLWFTGVERIAWEKAQLLLKAGLIEEAQSELRELPAPYRAEEKALRALVWAAAGGYGSASRLANEAWDEKAEFRRPPFTDAAFPRVFDESIQVEAKDRKLDPDLIRGLIKQESAFNVTAVSTSNALGLMQMIPPTAKEIAQNLKLGALELPKDLFDPKRNIKMGSYYLSQMLTKYQGHVPLALAAYNAGPARMDRWIRTRTSLKNLALSRSSAPENEIWIDEIPYNETSLYVKAILRNLLLYKLLADGRVEMRDPVW
jgi:soluble lytic murein transglycosylase